MKKWGYVCLFLSILKIRASDEVINVLERETVSQPLLSALRFRGKPQKPIFLTRKQEQNSPLPIPNILYITCIMGGHTNCMLLADFKRPRKLKVE